MVDIHPVCLPVLVLEVATVAHVVSEKLGKIFGSAIGLCPSIVGRFPRRGCRLFCFFLSFCRLDWVAFIVIFYFPLFLNLFFDSLLNHVLSDVESGLLFIVL